MVGTAADKDLVNDRASARIGFQHHAEAATMVHSSCLGPDDSDSDRPLGPAGTDQKAGRTFQGTETQGSIGEAGAWNLSTGVTHNRQRCATYETGIQLGKGNPACTKVEWLTEADFGSSRRHCNSAVMIHKGSGKLTGSNDVYQTSTCVRVVTKCTGAC